MEPLASIPRLAWVAEASPGSSRSGDALIRNVSPAVGRAQPDRDATAMPLRRQMEQVQVRQTPEV